MDELMTHFMDDAWSDFGQANVTDIHKGKDEITNFYKGNACGALTYSEHLVANPVIGINGNKAKESGYIFVPYLFKTLIVI